MDDFSPPPVEHRWPRRDDLSAYVHDLWFRVVHSLLPHKPPRETSRVLPKLNSRANETYEFCNALYRDSLDRINKLEEKAVNLLPFVTALLALLTLVFAKVDKPPALNLALIPIAILLLLAILISLRCASVKAIKSPFVDDLYHADGAPKEDVDPSELATSLVACSVYNTTVGNNVADMLNAARECLKIALVLGIILVGIMLAFFHGTAAHREDTAKPAPITSTTAATGSPDIATPPPPPELYIVIERLRLRVQPDQAAPIRAVLAPNTVVVVRERNGEWYRVDCFNIEGTVGGWVHRDYLKSMNVGS